LACVAVTAAVMAGLLTPVGATATPTLTPATSPTPALAPPGAATPALWRCEVAYLPARSTWVRQVEIETDGQRVTALRIDDIAPHAFTLVELSLVTSVDNERIVIDLASRQWQSDFRGLAQGRGRCEAAQD
jgi:hypothetical protein